VRYEAQWPGGGNRYVVSGNRAAFLKDKQDNCFKKQPRSLFLFQLPNTSGTSMTEQDNEASNSSSRGQDEIAKYRLKLEETADLVARIRHEINNPLTGVLGQAQLLLREDLSERSRKRVKTIEDLALRLRDVVAQLREVQRPGNDSESTDLNGSDKSEV
jgi:signal transduction histidine kinase